MQTLKGIPVSPGIVVGRVFVLDEERRRIPKRHIAADLVVHEQERLREAINAGIGELRALRSEAQVELGDDAAAIFAFHIGMLSDPRLCDPMYTLIETERVTAEYAAWKGFHDLADQYASIAEPTIQTKVDDIYDLTARVLRHLIGEHASQLSQLDHQAVVIARDLTPSQTAAFDRTEVIAFATDMGGRTSHTAIFAKAIGIPAVVGLGRVTDIAYDGVTIIIDGERGTVVIDPNEETLDQYESRIKRRRLEQLSLAELSSLASETRDGVKIELYGNIEFASEIPAILEAGGDGVGLYRTEFLYLTSSTEPTEEDHYRAYTGAIRRLNGKLLTIRTVDLGADKYTQERAAEPERNPFLGLRSIRYCLQSLPMFQRQLRAVLRASALGHVKIMFPLISSTTEFRQARYLLHDVMEDLDEEKIPFDRNVKIGMMVEVPSAALMADTFAREVDFFSIGTNDLVQYTLAVDRTNERVASLYNPTHPAVIKLIRHVIRAANRNKIPVSCCGESAGELEFAMLLIGLGLRTLSVTASAIPPLKRLIRSVTVPQCERLARKAATLDSDVAVSAYLRDRVRKILPEALDGRSAE